MELSVCNSTINMSDYSMSNKVTNRPIKKVESANFKSGIHSPTSKHKYAPADQSYIGIDKIDIKSIMKDPNWMNQPIKMNENMGRQL